MVSTLRFGGPAAVLEEAGRRLAGEVRSRLDAPHWVRSELSEKDRERFIEGVITLCRTVLADAIMKANHAGRNGNGDVRSIREEAQLRIKTEARTVFTSPPLAEPEALQMANITARLFDSVSREPIDESHRLGVNHSVRQEDHERPTVRVTPKP